MNWRQSEWRYLAFLNYEVSRDSLVGLLPRPLEPDELEGSCYLSLVGMLSRDSRWLGKTPAGAFSETIRLLAHVKRKGKEGWRKGYYVVGEVADRGEDTRHSIHFEEGGVDHYGRPYSNGVVHYEWKRGDEWRKIDLKTSGLPQPSGFSPIEHALLRKGWWYRKTKVGLMEFALKYPDWFYWEASEALAVTDLEELSGREWAPLMNSKPTLAFLAKGSQISLGFPSRL